jgi:hypothetical protein
MSIVSPLLPNPAISADPAGLLGHGRWLKEPAQRT